MMPETIKLGAGFHPNSHQLRLVHHPQAVVVEQPEMHGPPKTTYAITPIEGAGKEHVLCADKNGGAFGVDVPVAVIFATH